MKYLDSEDELVSIAKKDDFDMMLEEYSELSKVPMKFIIGRKEQQIEEEVTEEKEEEQPLEFSEKNHES